MTSAISVSGLTKRFGSVQALDGVDFEVEQGTVFGLLGPNGAGKTTIVRVLATILPPDGGRAEVLGHDVVSDPQAVRTSIGLAGQNAAVDPNLTGFENLRLVGQLTHLARSERNKRSRALLEQFGLAGAGDRPVRTYSGGMRRRLDVAAALLNRPPVLFLDEPTTGLDIEGRAELWKVIRDLVGEGTTVLLTTQYLEEADRLADRVAVVDTGRIVVNDSPARLKARLGATVIEMTFDDEHSASSALEAIARLGLSPERENDLVRFSSNDGAGALLNVLRSVDDSGASPTSLSVREPSLDDVFLALTGHHSIDENLEGVDLAAVEKVRAR
ncbi:MAG: ATP-binding cassette domain-containing protein [Acidimicrobiales bacterium]